jgi:hypothetical protein
VPVFVVLTEPEYPLVPLDARAEVTAGLSIIVGVILAPEGPDAAIAALSPCIRIDDEEEDRKRTKKLTEHVRSRSRI